MMVANSNRPAPQLTEVIDASRQQYALSLESENVPAIDAIIKQHPDLLTGLNRALATKQLVLNQGTTYY